MMGKEDYLRGCNTSRARERRRRSERPRSMHVIAKDADGRRTGEIVIGIYSDGNMPWRERSESPNGGEDCFFQ